MFNSRIVILSFHVKRPHIICFPGLLFFPSKLGFEKVHDWMVFIHLTSRSNNAKLLKICLFKLYIVIYYVCSVVLFPVAVTFFVTWWFVQFVDGFFSPLYDQLGIDIFGKCLLYPFSFNPYPALGFLSFMIDPIKKFNVCNLTIR